MEKVALILLKSFMLQCIDCRVLCSRLARACSSNILNRRFDTVVPPWGAPAENQEVRCHLIETWRTIPEDSEQVVFFFNIRECLCIEIQVRSYVHNFVVPNKDTSMN